MVNNLDTVVKQRQYLMENGFSNISLSPSLVDEIFTTIDRGHIYIIQVEMERIGNEIEILPSLSLTDRYADLQKKLDDYIEEAKEVIEHFNKREAELIEKRKIMKVTYDKYLSEVLHLVETIKGEATKTNDRHLEDLANTIKGAVLR